MNNLITAFLLALITERVMAALLAPVRVRWPDLNLWFVIYIAWLLGGVLAYLANINLFAELVPGLDPQFGRILTAIVAGGGANLLHDLFDHLPTNTLIASSVTPGVITASVRTEGKEPTPWLPADHEPITQNAPMPGGSPGKSPDRPISPR